MGDDSTLVFAYYKDGAIDPTFLYFAHEKRKGIYNLSVKSSSGESGGGGKFKSKFHGRGVNSSLSTWTEKDVDPILAQPHVEH
ncbi:hypothetical protein ACS0TY_018876 [Phlomoides rotata]